MRSGEPCPYTGLPLELDGTERLSCGICDCFGWTPGTPPPAEHDQECDCFIDSRRAAMVTMLLFVAVISVVMIATWLAVR
jgi:hypothetical protein